MGFLDSLEDLYEKWKRGQILGGRRRPALYDSVEDLEIEEVPDILGPIKPPPDLFTRVTAGASSPEVADVETSETKMPWSRNADSYFTPPPDLVQRITVKSPITQGFGQRLQQPTGFTGTMNVENESGGPSYRPNMAVPLLDDLSGGRIDESQAITRAGWQLSPTEEMELSNKLSLMQAAKKMQQDEMEAQAKMLQATGTYNWGLGQLEDAERRTTAPTQASGPSLDELIKLYDIISKNAGADSPQAQEIYRRIMGAGPAGENALRQRLNTPPMPTGPGTERFTGAQLR